jgi:CC2D2A N-terminal C2 domain
VFCVCQQVGCMEQVPAEEVRRCRLASQTQCYVQLTVDGCHASQSPPVALRHDFTLDVQHVFECVDRQTDRQNRWGVRPPASRNHRGLAKHAQQKPG